MLDKLVDMHKNPINILLNSIGIIIMIFALWLHNISLIIISAIIIILGHAFPYKGKRGAIKRRGRKR